MYFRIGAILYILNITDLIFTKYFIKLYGIRVEANPFGRWLFNNGLADISKVLAILPIALLVYLSAIDDFIFAKISLWALMLVYLVVNVRHLYLIAIL